MADISVLFSWYTNTNCPEAISCAFFQAVKSDQYFRGSQNHQSGVNGSRWLLITSTEDTALEYVVDILCLILRSNPRYTATARSPEAVVLGRVTETKCLLNIAPTLHLQQLYGQRWASNPVLNIMALVGNRINVISATWG